MPRRRDGEGLRAGDLIHRVTLVAPAESPARNELGETIDASSDEVTTWAEVKTLSGRELVYAQQVVGEATSLVTIRMRPGVDRFKSLRYRDRVLNINAAVPDETETALLLYCSEEA